MTVPEDFSTDIPKLYVVTRRDLTWGAQSAQSAHAVAELALTCPTEFKEWHDGSNVIIMLTERDGFRLALLLRVIWEQHIPAVPFYEPDFGGQLTAFAACPNQTLPSMLKDLPLALPEPRWRVRLRKAVGR